ncbi:SigE family RNA polymerase sigma factor [Streptacidiphilus sp. N1-3]|uniref:SigE family RNA polymerase sigma factor n=1 Tax=Streptacidiphilus alkalitolerans TaxID=3342712 RepID=A0ABV6X0G1_9ACTN
MAGERDESRNESREQSFDGFYAATFRQTVGQVYAMTGSLAEAEDCVQEAYARAWQRWPRVSGYADPQAWVRTVAYRISVSSWRKAVNRLTAHRRSREDPELPGLGPDHLALVAALWRISSEQRQAIVLHHLVGLSVEEVAEQTGAPTGTVKARLARGRRALAPHLSEGPEGGGLAERSGVRGGKSHGVRAAGEERF